MDKLIEMIVDGRLSLILVPLVLLVAWELWPWWEHARKFGKSARYYK